MCHAGCGFSRSGSTTVPAYRQNGVMTSRPPALAVAAVSVALLTGCAAPHSVDATPPDGVPTPDATAAFDVGEDENFLVVRAGTEEIRLGDSEVAYMFEPAPADIPAIASDEVYVFVRPAGWTLDVAQLEDVSGGCGYRTLEPETTDLGGGWWKTTPVGAPGEYTMRISAGSGPGLPFGGEVGATSAYVRWTTSTGTAIPATAGLDVSIFPGEPGRISVTAERMSITPASIAATATVTDDEGVSSTVTLATPDDICVQPGDLFLEGDMAAGERDAIDDHSYAYDVTLTLDGVTYRATGNTATNHSALEFTPALP